MNIYTSYLFFTVVCFCLQGCYSEEKNNILSKELFNNKNIKFNISGEWSVNLINAYQCNVCPKIIFYKNGNGKVGLTYSEMSFFKWEMKNDTTLNIKVFKKNDFLKEGIYNLKFTNNSELLTIKLGVTDNQNLYLFSKLNSRAD